MFKLALNAGHGINTAGKRCMKIIDPNETREWVLNSRICNKIEQKLSAYEGIEILRTDDVTGAVDKTIATRAKSANSFGADLYLSIHHNAGINGGAGGGIMAFTYLSVDNTTLEWQTELYHAAIKYTGLKGNRSTPLAKQDLGECRQTSMPAILMECGFMDSTTDTPIILTENYAEKIASAFLEVISRKAGLKVKQITSNNQISTSDEEIYRVRSSWDNSSSQIGAYKVLSNAISSAQKNKLNVYDKSGNCIWEYTTESTSEDKIIISDSELSTIKNLSNSFISKLLSLFSKNK